MSLYRLMIPVSLNRLVRPVSLKRLTICHWTDWLYLCHWTDWRYLCHWTDWWGLCHWKDWRYVTEQTDDTYVTEQTDDTYVTEQTDDTDQDCHRAWHYQTCYKRSYQSQWIDWYHQTCQLWRGWHYRSCSWIDWHHLSRHCLNRLTPHNPNSRLIIRSILLCLEGGQNWLAFTMLVTVTHLFLWSKPDMESIRGMPLIRSHWCEYKH